MMGPEDPDIQAALAPLEKLVSEGKLASFILFASFVDLAEKPPTRAMRFDFGNAYANQGIVQDYVTELEANKNAVAWANVAAQIQAQQQAAAMRANIGDPRLHGHSRNGHPR